MTYCGGILVREGLVMFADTRTNAGVDNISTFRKLHIFKDPKKRVMAIASAGNLSMSQSVVSILTEGYDNPDTGEHETLMNAPTLFQAAQRVGHVVRTVRAMEGKALEASDVTFDVSFLFGGQIVGERMRLFMVYSVGNFIECTVDTPYLQIGEHKYGKPVLDRAINYEMDIYDALKVGLVSVDSTMRSNLSVGMPIDIMVLRRDTCDPELIYRIANRANLISPTCAPPISAYRARPTPTGADAGRIGWRWRRSSPQIQIANRANAPILPSCRLAAEMELGVLDEKVNRSSKPSTGSIQRGLSFFFRSCCAGTASLL